jgi:NTE family protein
MYIKFYSFLFLFFIPFFIFGQEPVDTVKVDNERPKIGLVLSGGGAKGFAYVGILKAMEEANIRPDYIVGTSIGAIVAGLYAIGYSADELDTLIREVNWGVVLSNNVPLTYISFEEKEYYERYLITLPIKNKKLTLPSGVIEGQMLSDLLNKLTWPAMKYESFDDFPIPFRCLATDVSTGESIIFDKGSLSKALRASMSIPSAFTAVDLDTTLAVDGGVLNNFPVNVVKDMGADIIIGLDVSDGFENAKEIGSMAGIISQISMFESLKRADAEIKECDFYIHLDMEGYETADFGSTPEILAIGKKIGKENEQRFKDLAVQLNIKPEKTEFIHLSRDSILLSQIIIEGNVRVPKKLILSKLNLKQGQYVSQSEIEEGVLQVYGINSFKKVVYNIEVNPLQPIESILQVKVKEKGPANLKASVHYDNTFSAGVVLNITLRNLLGRGSRALIIGDTSENPKFRFDYLKYFGKRERFAINFVYNFLDLSIPTYNNGKKEDELKSTTNRFNLTIRSTQSLKHTFVGGIIYNLEKSKYRFANAVDESIKNAEFNTFQLVVGYIQNSTDNRNYPTKGHEVVFYGKYIFDNKYKLRLTDEFQSSQEIVDEIVNSEITPDGYGKIFFNYNTFIHFSDVFQMVPGIATGGILSTGSTSNVFSNFNIGGSQMVTIFDVRMRGINFAELFEPNFLKFNLSFQNVLWKNFFLQYGANLLAYYPYIPLNEISNFSFDQMIDNYSMVGYGFEIRYKSILGPISFGMSGNTRDKYIRYYFQLGFSMNYND